VMGVMFIALLLLSVRPRRRTQRAPEAILLIILARERARGNNAQRSLLPLDPGVDAPAPSMLDSRLIEPAPLQGG